MLVTYGDMPLLQAGSLAKLCGRTAAKQRCDCPAERVGRRWLSFGEVVRAADGAVSEIVEVAEARQRANTAELLAIRELNAGVYCFEAGWLWDNLPRLPLRQARDGQEYYLTDMVGLAVAQGERVVATVGEDPDEFLGAGTRAELVAVEKAFRRRANRRWLESGVTLIDPETTYIDQQAIIGQDTVIWPNSYIQGHSCVGSDCVIGPNTILRDAQVGNGCIIEQAVVEASEIPSGTRVQPFTFLRDNKEV